MAPEGYGISGIGYPNMGLGTIGLGGGGAYSSYDAYMPSFMGMNSSIFGGMGGYGGLGMMGAGMGMMGYPLYMSQMQNQIEQNQITHAGNMHQAMTNYEISTHEQTDSAIFQKVMTNGDVQDGIDRLYCMVRKGDQKGIEEEYNKLESIIFSNYGKEIQKISGKGNPANKVRHYIEQVYNTVVSAQTGETANLRQDIIRYGDGAIKNGFYKGFYLDHHDQYVDETINHIYGERMDHKEDQEYARTISQGAGAAARILKKGVVGGTVATGAYVAGTLSCKGIRKLFDKNYTFKWENKGVKMGRAFAIGALALIGFDIYRQIAHRNSAAA